MRDNISLLMAFFLVNHKVVICLLLAILSAERRASMYTVSSIIPKKVSCVVVLSGINYPAAVWYFTPILCYNYY